MAKFRKYPKPGDIIGVPLGDGKLHLAYYLVFDDFHNQMGPFVLILDRKVEPGQVVEQVDLKEVLFGPVYVDVNSGVRRQNWKVVGHQPVEPFEFPEFRMGMPNSNWSGYQPDVWRVRQRPMNERFVGVLSAEQQKLETLTKWSPETIMDRIEGRIDALAADSVKWTKSLRP